MASKNNFPKLNPYAMIFPFSKRKPSSNPEEILIGHEERKFNIRKEQLESIESARMLAEEKAITGII